MHRREFIERTAAAMFAASALRGAALRRPAFKISLAQWSWHRRLRGEAGDDLDNLDFAVEARKFGFGAVEYVNQFFKDRADDAVYLDEMRARSTGEGVRNLVIMCDGEGALGDPDDAARARAVKNHEKWVRAARRLGCHSIRVNAESRGERAEQERLAADGLRRLTEFADGWKVNVIVENHGGLSSDGSWLAAVMRRVAHPRCGTLPDFGNFRIDEGVHYDRYKGVGELMPFAKAVSAKSHDFDEAGAERHTDYRRMMKIVLAAGYRGYVGVEFEGHGVSEDDGVRKTKALLKTVRSELAR